jgi:hypothetical protein
MIHIAKFNKSVERAMRILVAMETRNDKHLEHLRERAAAHDDQATRGAAIAAAEMRHDARAEELVQLEEALTDAMECVRQAIKHEEQVDARVQQLVSRQLAKRHSPYPADRSNPEAMRAQSIERAIDRWPELMSRA